MSVKLSSWWSMILSFLFPCSNKLSLIMLSDFWKHFFLQLDPFSTSPKSVDEIVNEENGGKTIYHHLRLPSHCCSLTCPLWPGRSILPFLITIWPTIKKWSSCDHLFFVIPVATLIHWNERNIFLGWGHWAGPNGIAHIKICVFAGSFKAGSFQNQS